MTLHVFGCLVVLAGMGALGCSKGGSPNGPPPSGPGTIRLVTVPGSATARLDGGAAAYTDAQFDHVAAGPHQLSLSLLGYADSVVSITVSAGGVATDTVRLRPLPGTPTTIAEVWNGSFFYPGPLALSPTTGKFYVTAHVNLMNVLAVIAPSGAVLHQSYIPDPDANPAFDIALDSHDNAFVATKSYGNVILIFDSNGSLVTSIGRRDPKGSDGLAGIAIGPGDTVHVSARFAGAAVVEKYTPQGVFAYAFPNGTPNTGPIEVAGDGTIYVGAGPDPDTPQIRKYSRTGTLIQSWPAAATPRVITRGPGGTLYVTSWLGGGVPYNTLKAPNRMEVFTLGGVRLAQWAIENRTLASLDRHAVDAEGNVYMPVRNDLRVLRYGFE